MCVSLRPGISDLDLRPLTRFCLCTFTAGCSEGFKDSSLGAAEEPSLWHIRRRLQLLWELLVSGREVGQWFKFCLR